MGKSNAWAGQCGEGATGPSCPPAGLLAMRPESGPGLRARSKAGQGKGREAGLQLYGQ